MSVSEFSLIKRFFTHEINNTNVNQLGVGDDCALIKVPEGYQLAVTTDTMVEGVHFFPNVDPKCLGHKLLAVNLSDLAAMGAMPVAMTLAITLPNVDEKWLMAFSEGLTELAERFSVDLVGGDTTSGSLTLTIQAMGLIPEGQALKRSTAKVGDLIYVTGSLGGAGLGLKIEQGYQCDFPEQALQQFHQPQPKVNEGMMIRSFANACIDLSDGIASDLQHILSQSGVGGQLDWDKLPRSQQVDEYIKLTDDWSLPLSAGEDYQLCFTVSAEKASLVPVEFTQVGVIEAMEGLRIKRLGVISDLKVKGFEHFY